MLRHWVRCSGIIHSASAMTRRGSATRPPKTTTATSTTSNSSGLHNRRGPAPANTSTSTSIAAPATETAAPQPVAQKPIGRFQRYAREHGVFFAVYLTVSAEVLVWVITLLLQWRVVADGDASSIVAALGLGKYVDLSRLDRSVSVLGLFELSGRLALNYTAAAAIVPMLTPLQVPFCLATTPALKRLLRRK